MCGFASPFGWESEECVAFNLVVGTWYTFGWDLTKNICELYSTGGGISTAYTYTPIGKVTSSGNITQPIQWSCEFHDTELGLVYYNYRCCNVMSGMWLSRDFIDYNNLYSYVPSPICEQDVLGLSNETRFMWSGIWYDDEGGSGFGPNSSDIRIGIFDFQYSFTCCDSQSVDGGNLNPENNKKNIETSAYLKMVQYTINNSITEFKGTKCEKAYKFTTSATMISPIKRIFWFTWSELIM